MNVISLTSVDLSIAAFLVVSLAILSIRMKLGLTRQIIVAGIRTTVQLLLIGLVLKALFDHMNIIWIMLISFIMLIAAGREVMSRQKRKFSGLWGFGAGTVSMFISSFSITVLALTVVIDITPWYEPQYAIPLLGMMLGNTMNGIAVCLDRLTQSAWEQRKMIEARLMLGQEWSNAIEGIRRESIRSGMIPIINSMAAAGIVSLPGMMTGQIIAGSPPLEAVKYQILIMFLISGGTGFGTIVAAWIGSRRLFDDRDRLRLDRLKKIS
ncbi:MAG: iron export ABC transporter permease subunit FetB [Deltaproteobacteria bacterium]|nr:iron export ABC transporter permease subunit FetB [Deltaproteobacteria bacterium]MBW1813475.1 iron export ABC transporter permease subunit FetB [Deltaproteobacteria bacterium]MBW1846497.1 iron export ABC transporter permease subunit FetB [Deltaproteobacteria bacterium]